MGPPINSGLVVSTQDLALPGICAAWMNQQQQKETHDGNSGVGQSGRMTIGKTTTMKLGTISLALLAVLCLGKIPTPVMHSQFNLTNKLTAIEAWSDILDHIIA